MKQFFKRTLCLLLCICMLIPLGTQIGFAAKELSKVQKLSVASKTSDTVKLKWTSVKGAKGYKVLILNKKTGKWKSEAFTKSTTYTDKKLTPGKQYSYSVRAYKLKNSKKVYSDRSKTLVAQTNPENVKTLKILGFTETSIALYWSKTKGATHYYIYRYNSSTKKYVRIGSTTETGYTISGLTPSTSYSFRVKAVAKIKSKETYSAQSKGITARTSLEAVQGIDVTKASEDTIILTWQKVTNAAKYQVYYYDDAAKKWMLFYTTSNTNCTLDGVDSSLELNIRIRAIDSTGVASPFSEPMLVKMSPAAPTGLTAATSSDNGIALKWNASDGASGYKIERYNPLNGTWEKIGVTTKTSYVDKNLKETSTYTYRVCAYLAYGDKIYYGDYCQSISYAYKSVNEPKSIYIKQLEEDGVLGYLYDPFGMVFYTSSDPWQRNFGFNVLYDVAAPFTALNYATVRFKFRADEKDWMIQAWKGQYGFVFYGGEVGVYTKPTNRSAEHYDCASDADMLKMSMTFYKYNSLTKKWVKRFSRPYGTYWWITGFKPGNNGYNFSIYKLDMRITMKSFEMLDGFLKSAEKQKIPCRTEGLDVYFEW